MMCKLHHRRNSFHATRIGPFLCWIVVLLFSSASSISQTPRPARIAVLDLGSSPTGVRVAALLRGGFRSQTMTPSGVTNREFDVVDSDQAGAAALGAGFNGSLNMTLSEARDLGAAIGCDFFIVGNSQTVRRSPSSGTIYYEAFASIFLVSARTGRLLSWERPEFQRPTPNEAEDALLATLASEETRHRYTIAIRRAQEDERAERARAIEPATTPVIEPMSDEETSDNATRPPRPFRRPRPLYPESASRADAEATVDALVDIDARGEVGKIEVVRWAGYGLDQSVIDTVKQMHFFPAMRDGVAIPMRVLLRYNFRKPPIQNLSQ